MEFSSGTRISIVVGYPAARKRGTLIRPSPANRISGGPAGCKRRNAFTGVAQTECFHSRQRTGLSYQARQERTTCACKQVKLLIRIDRTTIPQLVRSKGCNAPRKISLVRGLRMHRARQNQRYVPERRGEVRIPEGGRFARIPLACTLTQSCAPGRKLCFLTRQGQTSLSFLQNLRFGRGEKPSGRISATRFACCLALLPPSLCERDFY